MNTNNICKVLKYTCLKGATLNQYVSKNRIYLMGCAIFMVLTFHLFNWIHNPIGIANIGYIGVDIFFFLSGVGLCNSYSKNSIKVWFKNRIVRIYPAYAVSVLIAYFLSKGYSIYVLFLNLSTIGFWIHGGIYRFDWYLESLFILYLLFPMFYILSKAKIVGVLSILLAVIYLLFTFDVSWWYDCFLSRLPIFLFGVVFSRYELNAKAISIINFAGIVLFLPTYIFISHFLATSLIALPLICCLLSFVKYVHNNAKKKINLLGFYSLEIYAANVLALSLIGYMQPSNAACKLLYLIIGQIIFTFVLIPINRYVKGIKK